MNALQELNAIFFQVAFGKSCDAWLDPWQERVRSIQYCYLAAQGIVEVGKFQSDWSTTKDAQAFW